MRRARVAIGAAVCVAAMVLVPGIAGGQRTRAPSIVENARIDTTNGVNFHALVAPETVYVGQQATYQVGVFLSDEVRYRLRRNPEFVPPELRAMLSYDLTTSGTTLARRREGARGYDTHVFQRALFPLSAGTFVIPPARLSYSLPLSASFFSREESHSLSSEEVRLIALAPPAQGRPAGYAGAVGALQVGSRIDSASARVGDPMVLTVRVDGAGNVNLFPRPAVTVPWGRTVSGDERVELDSTSTLVRGAKEFDYLITPTRSGSLELPAVRYPYFNPYTERYEIAIAPPRMLHVAPGTLAAIDTTVLADSARVLPIRRVMAPDVATPLFARGAFWLVLLLGPLPALGVALWTRAPTRATSRPVDELRQLAALPVSEAATDRAPLRRAYTRSLALRVGLTPALLADRHALVRALRRSGVSAGTAARADAVLAELDAAVYARDASGGTELARRAIEALEAVDQEAVPRDVAGHGGGAPRSLGVVLALIALPLSLSRAQTPASAADAFRDGARAYDARAFHEAARAFGEAARDRPRSADAWANAGSAAWMAGDSVSAAAAWQHALRLDPIAGDVRARLSMLPGFRPGSLEDVPAIAPDAAAIVGAVLWLGGWLLVAIAIRRRDIMLRRLGVGVVCAATLTVGGGLWAHERTVGGRLAVLLPRTQLLSAPTLGAAAAAPVQTGDVARIVSEQGVWSQVRLSGGREGWVETDGMRSLGALR